MSPPVEIPDKPSFKAAEVCELVQIPSYVLRTWENEFKELGVARTQGGQRSYRRQDVELAVRIKDLVFSEHLTLAGVRRRLEQEQLIAPPATEAEDFLPTGAPHSMPAPVRAALTQVKDELRSLLQALAGEATRGRAETRGDAPASMRNGRLGEAPALPGFGDDAAAPAQAAAAASKPSSPRGRQAKTP